MIARASRRSFLLGSAALAASAAAPIWGAAAKGREPDFTAMASFVVRAIAYPFSLRGLDGASAFCGCFL